MTRRGLNILAWIVLGLVCSSAQSSLPRGLDSLILVGSDALLRGSYDAAVSVFAQATHEYPLSAAGPLFEAASLMQGAEDLTASLDESRYDSLLTLVEVRAAFAGNRDSMEAWNSVFRATARGMMVLDDVRKGAWIAAIRDAVGSASYGREAFRSDRSLADAGLSLGSYLYWRSRKTEVLHWLPFVADERGEGIRLLEDCAQKGRYNRFAAMNALLWIMVDAGDVAGAEHWARAGLAAYPTNRVFLRGLAAVLERRREFQGAADAWSQVEISLRRAGAKESVARLGVLLARARCLIASGDIESVPATLKEAGSLLTLEPPEIWNNRMRPGRREFTDLQRRLQERATTK